ncbi:hypothetical protein FVB9288_00033 [Flavobacterium sp. CECT 9288]|uniref:hypothetical protein n=1 Tax=Flavobacterium sp. CECT 9288 TaxID=2845819 RepID=UPI001E29189B|nr:hypothetical protein [Flavobacterium sp. CECT 9288]CAH0334451.1 hypothetical protein FVB9288_00033 [Flavobacterium sp. CECT 9288]
MKKKLSILRLLFTISVLVSMLFQSLHKYEHIAQQLAHVECVHEKGEGPEITHQHHSFELCAVCDYKLSGFISQDFLSLDTFYFDNFKNTIDAESIVSISYFKGSLFGLRAPPLV